MMKIPTVSDLLFTIHHDRDELIARARLRRQLILAGVIAGVALALSAVLRIAYGV